MVLEMRILTSDPINRLRTIPLWTFWDGGFTEAELDKIERFCDTLEMKDAEIVTGEQSQTVDRTVRITKTAFIYPTNDATWIFERIFNIVQQINGRFYEFDLNGCGGLQFARYDEVGSGYDWHIDGSIGNQAIAPADLEPRKLSAVLALSRQDEYAGGDLQVRMSASPDTVAMPRGRLATFPSFVLHRVTPLEHGIRKTLTAWFVGPKFQ